MAGRPQRTSRTIPAFLCGLVGALVVAGVFRVGLIDHAELDALDLCFRRCSRLDSSSEIVHVDVDDSSLTELGRWPWPRAQMAGILDVLAECGARQIAMDVIYPEPQNVRYVSDADEVYAEDATAELLAEAPPIPVYDDMLLADAIAATQATVAMHLDFGGVPVPASQSASYVAWHRRAVKALTRYAIPASAVAGYPLAEGVVTPPLVTLAEAAGLTGYVTIQPDSDGVVRRMRLLARGDGAVFAQFGMALAAQELTGDPDAIASIRADDSAVTVEVPDGSAVRIPVDSEGRMLINWVAPDRDTVTIIPAVQVGNVWRQRQSFQVNRRRMRVIQLQLVTVLGDSSLMAGFIGAVQQSDRLFQQRLAAERQRYLAMLHDPAHAPGPPTELIQAEADVEADLDILARRVCEGLEAFTPDSEELGKEVDRLVALWDELAAANERIESGIDEQLARIRQRVEGKLCLVGASATGVGDFVPTAVGKRSPGVRIHSAIINTIVSGRFVRPASGVLSVGIIIVLGVLVSVVASRWPLVRAAVVTVVIAAAYVIAGAYLLFAQLGLWAPLVTPVAAMGASFLLVAVYRELTEERAKRHIRGMFAHALSPALVDKLLDDPSLAELGGQQRELTCMFSDLAGFTSMSQRLGPQKTVRALNHYFDTMTDVVQDFGGGFLNKFLGDGIFCFFGAPVLQDDHAARAVRSAVEFQRRLDDLNAAVSAELDEPAALAIRVGLAGGEAMVGNCGSTRRMDYTAIGDCVNLASRLESANKEFHTRVLVADVTWQAAGIDDLPVRSVGPVLIRGVEKPVELWEVWVSPADEDLTAALATFAEGVAAFGQGWFDQAEGAFRTVAEAISGDYLSELYLALCEYGRSWSPGQPWQPSCGDGDVGRIAPPTTSS